MNKEFLGERRRALEDEYFARLDRVLIDRLRAARAADRETHGADAPGDVGRPACRPA
jgi:hypothetical protein